MRNLYTQFSESLQDVGIAPISLTLCYKLLAIVNEYPIEEFVFNEKLHTDVMYAQKRLNLLGGETPRKEEVEELKRYIKEVQSEDCPKWAIDLMKDRYNVNLPTTKIG